MVIAALTALASAKGRVLFTVDGPLDFTALGCFFAAAFCVVCSWGHALSALRIWDCPMLPNSRETVEWMKAAELIQTVLQDAQQAPSNCNTQPWQVHVVSGAKRDELAMALLAADDAERFTPDYYFDMHG